MNLANVTQNQIWRKSKTVLYRYRPFHCIHKNRWYKDIAEDVKTRFDTSNYELDRPLPKGKNRKVIWLIYNKLHRKIMRKFVELRAKTYSW